MKFTLAVILFSLGSVSWAADHGCSTVWAYQPFADCNSAANDIDKSTCHPAEYAILTGIDTDHADICQILADKYNGEAKGRGEYYTGTDYDGRQVQPQSKKPRTDLLGATTSFDFQCRVPVYAGCKLLSRGKSCGTQSTWKFTETKDASLGEMRCLSCDGRSMGEAVKCLTDNIKNIIGNTREDLSKYKPVIIKKIDTIKRVMAEKLTEEEAVILYDFADQK